MWRFILSGLLSFVFAGSAMAEPRPRNVVLFVADGLRDGLVNAANAPAMDGS